MHSIEGPMAETKKDFKPQHHALSRDLGLFPVTMIGVGAMIGAGIFVLTGIAAGVAGPALLLVFLLNGAIALLTAMSYAELGSSLPTAGGGFSWVRESLGGVHGFMGAWMSWFAHATACSLYVLGFGFYFAEALHSFGLGDVLGGFTYKGFAVLVAAVFAYVNYRGASETATLGGVITVLKVGILIVFVISGVIVIAARPDWTAPFIPFKPMGWSGILMAMGLTYIAFEGYEVIVQAGEEVKNPERNIPRAIFLSMAIVVPVYVLVGFAALGAIDPGATTSWQFLAEKQEGAMIEAARQFMPLGFALLLLGGLAATTSALNATIYSSSRVAFAMGRDRYLPDLFSRVHPKRRTPHGAVLISAALIIAMALVLPIKDVASAADIMFILLFTQVNVALIGLRHKKPKLKRPFKVPLYPVTPALAIVLQLLLGVFLFHLSPVAWFTAAIWLMGGLTIYFGYSRPRESEVTVSKVIYEERELTEKEYKVLVPLSKQQDVAPLMTMATSLAKANDGEVWAMAAVEIPGQLPLSAGKRFVEQTRSVLDSADEFESSAGVPVHTLARVTHRADVAILDTVRETKPEIMVMGWGGYKKKRGTVLGRILDPVVRVAACNVAVVRWRGTKGKLKKLLLPTAGGPHARYAATLAAQLARANDASLTVCYVVPRDAAEAEREAALTWIDKTLEDADLKDVKLKKTLLESNSVERAIIDESKNHDLTIIGASNVKPWKKLVLGDIPRVVHLKSPGPVMMVRKYEGPAKSWLFKFMTPYAPRPDES
jgi:amino acid transporter/nucleotide-binding universal stress UspA family protein